MATQQEVIYNFMQSLDNTELKGEKALDEAIRASSNFKSFNALKKQFLADLKGAKSWHRFLVEKCGIILDNTDTGAISGADCGGATIKTSTDILPSEGKAKYPSGTSFTVDGLTIYGIPPKSTLTKDQQYVVRNLYSWWIRDALKQIKESYSFSFDEENTTNARLKLEFIYDEDNDGLAYVSHSSDDGKHHESRVLCVNMARFQNMSSADRHGTISNNTKSSLDRTLIHELTHGIMASNINYFDNLPFFFIEGGSAELIHGVDDERADEIIECAKNPTVFKNILIPINFDEPSYEVYAGGYMFLRYFAKQAATDTKFDYDTYRKTVSIGSEGGFATNYWDTVTMKGGSGNDSISNSGSNVTITAGKGDDSIKNYANKVTILGGNGADRILNEGSNVSIAGGKGDDNFQSSKGFSKITLDGGAGNDIFFSNGGTNISVSGGSGNDAIYNILSDYRLGKSIPADNFASGASVPTNGALASNDSGEFFFVDLIGGNNSTFTGGTGNDYIQNNAGKVLIYGDDGNDTIFGSGFAATIYGGDGDDVISNTVSSSELNGCNISITGFKAKIYGGEGDDEIKNTGDAVKIYGQNGDDTITNEDGSDVSILGGNGSDVITNGGDDANISGGAGNDSIYTAGSFNLIDGGAGADSINNEDYNSTINGGAGDDYLTNYGTMNSLAGAKGNDTIYSSGESSTLNGGAGNDSIKNEGVKAYVLGGSGNDSIRNSGDRVTLSGGKGNDYIKNSGGKHITYLFAKNMGNDTVVGFNDADTVQIVSGKYSASASGKNVVVKVGSSTLTLKNAVGKEINFISSSGKTSTKTYSASAKTAALLADDNFLTSNDLSALVKEKNISTYAAELALNVKELGMKNNLVTYNGKK